MAMQRSTLRLIVTVVSICLFFAAVIGALAVTPAHAQEPPPPPPDAAFAPASPDAISFTAAVNPIVANGLGKSNAAWGDYDNDGYLDLLLNGCLPNANICNVPFHRVYHNNAGAGFTLAYTLPETGGTLGRGAWGDYDNDGDLDILLAGWANGANALQVFQNTGSGFTLLQTFEQTNAYSMAWGDYNNDGHLDILMGDGSTLRRASGSIAIRASALRRP
ncbi:MAG: VCBS repeat-containing protein [Anaerolineales bacterium]|nr:VCBS repeat-containing protein [Anaerolineales bacterium]